MKLIWFCLWWILIYRLVFGRDVCPIQCRSRVWSHDLFAELIKSAINKVLLCLSILCLFFIVWHVSLVHVHIYCILKIRIFLLISLIVFNKHYLRYGTPWYNVLTWIKVHNNQKNCHHFRIFKFHNIWPKICLKMFWKGKIYKSPNGVWTHD